MLGNLKNDISWRLKVDVHRFKYHTLTARHPFLVLFVVLNEFDRQSVHTIFLTFFFFKPLCRPGTPPSTSIDAFLCNLTIQRTLNCSRHFMTVFRRNLHGINRSLVRSIVIHSRINKIWSIGKPWFVRSKDLNLRITVKQCYAATILTELLDSFHPLNVTPADNTTSECSSKDL